MILKKTNRTRLAEQGYMLLSVMLVMTLMLIAMAIEAPRIAQQIKRDKELELVHRGKDVATAIKHFVHKNGGRYPTSLEQLEDTNHIRYLRRRWKDPTTGESIWRLVHVGEAEIKIPTPSPGLNPNTNNPGLGGGTSGLSNNTPATSPNTFAPPVFSGTGPQANPQPGNQGQVGSLTTSNIGNGQTVGGGQIIGIASVNKNKSILEFNDKDEYDEWFFVYDLRLEQAGGTGVTVASPRAGVDTSSQGQDQRGGAVAPGTSQPSGTPAQPPQNPK